LIDAKKDNTEGKGVPGGGGEKSDGMGRLDLRTPTVCSTIHMGGVKKIQARAHHLGNWELVKHLGPKQPETTLVTRK